ncbi:MAG: hypothetical protein K2W95_08515 [Candidatus Obscuribacterales bacterium]|nr:hypothetical protein [Candidatus Obscuribacterales bacterium]
MNNLPLPELILISANHAAPLLFQGEHKPCPTGTVKAGALLEIAKLTKALSAEQTSSDVLANMCTAALRTAGYGPLSSIVRSS